MDKLTLEQLSHLKIVPRFFPLPLVLVIVMSPTLISNLTGGSTSSPKFTSSSLASGLTPLTTPGLDARMPETDVNDNTGSAVPCVGGELDKERVARDDRAAAAV